MGWGFIGDAVDAVGDAVSDTVDAVSDTVDAVSDGVSSAWDWTRDHWKDIAIAVGATVVFIGVTALTGGLGAPALLAFAAGGFASGVAGYGLSSWLHDQPFDWSDALTAGATGAVVSAATFGVARFATPALAGVSSRAASTAVVSAVPAGVRAGVVNTAAGTVFGAGTRAVQNAIADRPLGEGVADAAILGGLTGAVTTPLVRLNPGAVRTNDEPIPGPAHQPSNSRGIVGALDDPPPPAGPAVPPPPAPTVVTRGAGANDYGLTPGTGGVEPLSPIPPSTRTVLDSWHGEVARYQVRRPLVLTDDQLAVLAPGRGAPSNTLQAGQVGDLGNWNAAARLVNDYVATGADLTPQRVAEINRTLLAGTANDANAGVYRSQSGLEVGHHTGESFYYYANAGRVNAYLDDFFAWYRANEGVLPPSELAAASYQQLVRIHPFVDSNGRTTRLVMDWILQRNGLPPASWTSANSEAVHSTTDWVVYNVDRAVIESGEVLRTTTSDSTAQPGLPPPPPPMPPPPPGVR